VLSSLNQPRPPEPRAPADVPLPELAPVVPGDAYKAMALRAKDYILAGDIFQVVLAQRFTCEFPLPPLSLYRALRRTNPSPYMFHFDFGAFQVIGASPEMAPLGAEELRRT
jgi:anthranilate synthase component 1